MVGYNCFIIFQYYYQNFQKVTKISVFIKFKIFYENWNFCNFLKILKIEIFLKISISYENSKKKLTPILNFLKNFEILNFFWKFWILIFFFIDFRI